jgi:hypothetical protein
MSRTYRRSLGTLLVAALCLLLFAGGAVSCFLSAGASRLFFFFSGLAVLGAANLVGAAADRYTLGDEGIVYRSGLMFLLGRPPRNVPWGEVSRVREHRGLRDADASRPASAIVLTLRTGGRVVLDSLQNFEEVLAEVRRRCPEASVPTDRRT